MNRRPTSNRAMYTRSIVCTVDIERVPPGLRMIDDRRRIVAAEFDARCAAR
jgi:hypothetical protein